MPKIKSKKAVAKRFRLTKTGKVKRAKAFRGHLLTKKSRKRKMSLRRPGLVARSDRRTIRRLLAHR